MIIGKAKLNKLGMKKWLLIPKDIYLHRVWGKIRIQDAMFGKVTFTVRGEDTPKTVLEKQFRKGILIQLKEGRQPLLATEDQQQRHKVLQMTCKDGTRLKLILTKVVDIVPGFFDDEA